MVSVSQDFPAVSALELLVRANITVKSNIRHLLLKDASAQVLNTLHFYAQHKSAVRSSLL